MSSKIKKAQRANSLGLSIVMAVHNEAHNLSRSLTPLKKIYDELIVVDGESTDDTVVVAKSFGAQIISMPNHANFHINKQAGLKIATQPLVLLLDADEVLDDECCAWLRWLKTGAEQQYNGWWLRRRNFFMGRFLTKGGQYPDPSIRVFRQGKGYLPAVHVHEQLEIEGALGWAQGHMLHYSNPDFATYLRKWNHYTSLTAQQLYDQKVPISLVTGVKYLLWQPIVTWATIYLRHRGYVDGIPGLMFAVWSGLHYVVAYLKLWELYESQRQAKVFSVDTESGQPAARQR